MPPYSNRINNMHLLSECESFVSIPFIDCRKWIVYYCIVTAMDQLLSLFKRIKQSNIGLFVTNDTSWWLNSMVVCFQRCHGSVWTLAVHLWSWCTSSRAIRTSILSWRSMERSSGSTIFINIWCRIKLTVRRVFATIICNWAMFALM